MLPVSTEIPGIAVRSQNIAPLLNFKQLVLRMRERSSNRGIEREL